MTVDIREVAPDHPDVSCLLVQLGAHNAELHGSTDLDHSPPSSWLTALVAYDGPESVGLLGIRPFDATTVHLVRLFVTETARGRGLTLRLAHEAFEAARRVGYSEATWDTGTDVPAVVSASERLGATAARAFGRHADATRTRCFSVRLRDATARPTPSAPSTYTPRT